MNKKIIGLCVTFIVFGIVFFAIPFQTTELYQEQVRMQYQIIDPTDLTEQWNISLGFYQVGRVTVRNTDTEGGTFSVTYKFRNVYGIAKQETSSYFIASGDSHTFEFTYDSEMGEDVTGEYSTSEPFKTVIKTRTVNKTLFERLLGS